MVQSLCMYPHSVKEVYLFKTGFLLVQQVKIAPKLKVTNRAQTQANCLNSTKIFTKTQAKLHFKHSAGFFLQETA